MKEPTAEEKAAAPEKAQKLRDAMKCWGTEDKVLIDILSKVTGSEIRAITQHYNGTFKDDKSGLPRCLLTDIKADCSGDYEAVLLALCDDRAEFDAKVIFEACKGFGTNESAITSILCTRTPQEIIDIRSAYKHLFEVDLADVLKSETSGNLQDLYIGLVTLTPDQIMDPADPTEDVEELYKAGEGKWGTDEGKFIKKLSCTSPEYRAKVCAKYKELKGKDLDDVVRGEMGGLAGGKIFGDFGKAMVALITPPGRFHALRIHQTMHGMGTDEKMLIQLICSQRQRYLGAACEEFLRYYHTTIANMVTGDCSGDFKKVLHAVLANEGHPAGEKAEKALAAKLGIDLSQPPPFELHDGDAQKTADAAAAPAAAAPAEAAP